MLCPVKTEECIVDLFKSNGREILIEAHYKDMLMAQIFLILFYHSLFLVSHLDGVQCLDRVDEFFLVS